MQEPCSCVKHGSVVYSSSFSLARLLGGSNAGRFLDRDALDGGDIDITPLAITLPDWVFHGRTRDTEVGERIAEADVVVSNKAMLDAAALARAPKLRLICISATGTNNVDLEAARNRGIVVCNVRSYATASVVEHVFALLLSLRRRLPAYRDAVSAGGWQRSPQFTMLDFPIGELHGSTLGIVGYGELGRAVAQVAEAFGMRILVATRDGGSVGRKACHCTPCCRGSTRLACTCRSMRRPAASSAPRNSLS